MLFSTIVVGSGFKRLNGEKLYTKVTDFSAADEKGFVEYFTGSEQVNLMFVLHPHFEDKIKEQEAQPYQGDPLAKQVGGGHYKHMKIQPVEFINVNNIGYLEGNIIKYICRHASKNGAEDIKKVIHYAELILALKYGKPDA